MRSTKTSGALAAGAVVLLVLIATTPASASTSDDSFEEIAAANQAAVSEIDPSTWDETGKSTAELEVSGIIAPAVSNVASVQSLTWGSIS